jgi:O-antigen/teichoic acid export membrane protein
VIQRSALYITVGVFNLATSYLLGLYLARSGRLSDLGVIAMANSLVAPVFQLLGLQLRALVVHASDDKEVEAMAAIRVFTSIVGAAIGLGMLLLVGQISDPGVFSIGCCIVGLRAIDSLIELMQALHQRIHRDRKILITSSVHLVSNLIALLFAQATGLSLLHLLVIHLFVSLGVLLLGYAYPSNMMGYLLPSKLLLVLRSTDRRFVRLAQQSAVLSLTTVLISLASTFPRLSIQSIFGADQVGLLVAASYLAVPLNICVYSVIPVFVQRRFIPESGPAFRQSTITLYASILAAIALFYCLFLEVFKGFVLSLVLSKSITVEIPYYLFLVTCPLIFQAPASLFGQYLIARRSVNSTLWIGIATIGSCLVCLAFTFRGGTLRSYLFAPIVASVFQLLTSVIVYFRATPSKTSCTSPL